MPSMEALVNTGTVPLLHITIPVPKGNVTGAFGVTVIVMLTGSAQVIVGVNV
jgi:hypothetical protein